MSFSFHPAAEEELGTDSTLYVHVPLDVVLSYLTRAETTSGKVPYAQRLHWLKTRDVDERTLWISKFKNSQLTLGAVIKQTFSERSGVWIYDPPASQEADKDRDKDKQGNKRKFQELDEKNFCRETSDGKRICPAYNRGQCRNWCPKGELHVCSAKLRNGRACGMRGHTISNCRNRKRM